MVPLWTVSVGFVEWYDWVTDESVDELITSLIDWEIDQLITLIVLVYRWIDLSADYIID